MSQKLKVLDLFSGIGGFSLGLERTGGFETVAFCEIEPFCRRVLVKHWPGIPIYEDVRKLTGERLAADGISVDVICGGFPCQDISFAGKGAGLAGERSGLWREYSRIVGELRPCFVLVENVAALLGRGLGDVLGDLAALGYDAEWHCIPATAVGADHFRDRTWIVANPYCGDRDRRNSSLQMGWGTRAREIEKEGLKCRVEWTVESGTPRTAHGIPNRVDRCNALGNAIVPQIPELIGKAILETLEGGQR